VGVWSSHCVGYLPACRVTVIEWMKAFLYPWGVQILVYGWDLRHCTSWTILVFFCTTYFYVMKFSINKRDFAETNSFVPVLGVFLKFV
jgi:hypothetical protein